MGILHAATLPCRLFASSSVYMDSRVRPHLQSLGQHVLELTSVRELGNLGAFPADCPSQLCVCGFLPIGIILVQYGIPYAMRRGAKTSAHAIFASTSMIQKILFFLQRRVAIDTWHHPSNTLAPSLVPSVWLRFFASKKSALHVPCSICEHIGILFILFPSSAVSISCLLC